MVDPDTHIHDNITDNYIDAGELLDHGYVLNKFKRLGIGLSTKL